MKKGRLFALATGVVFCLATSAPAFAAETDAFGKVMPADVLTAINSQKSATFSLLNNDEDLNKVFMETSLDIDMPRVNLDEVHVTVPLTDGPVDESIKQQFRDHGYTEEEIAGMDIGDYINICSTWKLSDDVIDIAKYLYPELADKDISNWTYGQYTDYRYEVSCRMNAPTQEEAAAFAERGITFEDANWLLKEYGSYENILAQSDDTLRASLEDNYQFLIDQVVAYSDAGIAVSADNGGKMDPKIYVEVKGFSGYAYATDYVHVDAGTYNETYRATQESMVKKEVKALYGLNSVPTQAYLTNLYGAWSASQKGAHEGLDFVCPGSSYPTIYNLATGVVREPDANHKDHHLAIYDSGKNKTYSYLHMNKKSVSVGDSISALGTAVGQQGQKGNATGPHVHFEVHSENTSALGAEYHDDNLESISPYQMWHLN